MPDTFPMLKQHGSASEPVRICRADGADIPVRLRLLSYDGCELESDVAFATGELIRIHLYRMGWIRARVTCCQSQLVEVEFIQECPL